MSSTVVVRGPQKPAPSGRVSADLRVELPVRVYHWINAVALVALLVTGYLIGAPSSRSTRLRLTAVLVRLVRFIHFVAAFVYVFNFLARLYWGFVGNKYARWSAFFPLKRAQQQEIVDVIKADVLETSCTAISTGHNALAGVIYFGTFLAFVFQTITGFALYSSMSNSWLPRMFTWIVPLMGGEFGVRFWHHTFLCSLSRSSSFTFTLPSTTTTSRAAALYLRSSADGSSSGRSVTNSDHKTLVLGLGNVLMGDEGIGVEVVRALNSAASPTALNASMAAPAALRCLSRLKTLTESSSSTRRRTKILWEQSPHHAAFFARLPATLTAHDIGMKDLLDMFYIQAATRDHPLRHHY